MKTSELQGSALDWAVAQCEGRSEPEVVNNFAVAWYTWGNTHYSTDWAQGGPIIEREKVCVAWLSKQDLGMEPEHYCVAHIDGIYTRYGPTPLVAAMRCYVASKLGDEVEVPDEIVS
jgi:hypothetical protein